MDDLNGFRIEVRERDGAGASATYTYPMPVGQSWRFHHWIHNSTAYLDNYTERTDSVLSTVFIGNHFEQDLIVGNGVRKYYYLGGKRIATGNATGLYFIHGDQLGSTSLVTSITGTVTTQMLFKPFGLVRWWTGTLETDYRFTGQRQESNAALYDYGARFYDQQLGRFISADSIVPGAGNPQALNRFSYALNNPLRYTDPTGHCPNAVCEFGAGFFAQWASNIAAPVSPRLAESLSVKADDSMAKVAGRFVGNLASAAGAALEAAGGLTEIGGGAAACGTGVLCLGGAPAIAMGAAVTTHAGATAVVASQEAGKLGNILMASGTGGQGPDLPLGKFSNRNQLGKFMDWGTGKESALKAADELTIEKVRDSGLSLDDAKEWKQFYSDAFKDNPDNVSAEGRITFMDTFIDILSADQSTNQ